MTSEPQSYPLVLPGDGQEAPSTPLNQSNGNELGSITCVSHSHGQTCFPPHPLSQAGGVDERRAGGAGRLHGARAVPRAVTEHRWHVPGCLVGAVCPAFLGVTFSRGMCQLLHHLPRGPSDQSFFPTSPLLRQDFCPLSPPVIPKGWFCHLNHLLPFPQLPLAKSAGSPGLLLSLWAAAAI